MSVLLLMGLLVAAAVRVVMVFVVVAAAFMFFMGVMVMPVGTVSVTVAIILSMPMVVVVTCAVAVPVMVVVTCAMIMVVGALLSVVNVAAFTGMQDLDLDQIEDETDNSCPKHDRGINLRWVEESVRGFVEKSSSHNPDRYDGDDCAKYFSSVEAIAEPFGCMLCCDVECDDRYREAECV